MRVLLEDYHSPYQMVSLALDKETLNDLLQDNLPVLLVEPDKVVCYPEEYICSRDANVIARLQSCSNYDVFEVSEFGLAALFYDHSARDNTFMLTGRCNSNCIMCPASDKERDHAFIASLDMLRQAIQHIPADAGHFTITGGEPFLMKKDIFPFLQLLKDKFTCCSFLLLTNGRVFALPDYCSRLKEVIPADTLIGIPIHGSTAQKHNAITRAPGSFDQTILGIRNLLSLGQRIEVRIVVSALNADDIEAIAKLIVNKLPEVETVKIIGLEMLGNAHVFQDQVWIPYDKAFLAAKNAVDLLIHHGIETALYNFPLCAVDPAYWQICRKSISPGKVRYPKGCQGCAVQDSCGGLFAGTYRFMADQVKPIASEVL